MRCGGATGFLYEGVSSRMSFTSEFWNGRPVLVTGGASFIGSHLTERLVASGAEVRVADDLSSGKLENIEAVSGEVDFREGDLRDSAFAAQATEGREAVFHLAANHGGRGYIDSHPVECIGNTVLDNTVYGAALRNGVERIAFTSSACVYPVDLQEMPKEGNLVYLSEESVNSHDPGGASPDGEYGWGKLMGELALSSYVRQYGMKGVSCRLFTAYGERENETHAVIALIARAFIQADPYVIWGTGEQDRNFTYVGDIVEGVMRACERIEDGSAVNVGTAEHIRIKDVASQIFDVMGWEPEEIDFDTTKPVGVFSRAADLTRSREVLGWEPGTSFRDGLERTIEWYESTHSRDHIGEQLETLLTER
jgi:nucleoside-diphosphate-sugar epimerase